MAKKKKGSTKASTGGKDGGGTSTSTEEISWEKGLARWTALQSQTGNGIVPSDHKDQQLVHWADKQQVEYRKWKKGEETYIGADGFQMLERFDFPFLQEPKKDSVVAKGVPTSKAAAKPAGKKSPPQATSSSVASMDENDPKASAAPTPNAASDNKVEASSDTVEQTKGKAKGKAKGNAAKATESNATESASLAIEKDSDDDDDRKPAAVESMSRRSPRKKSTAIASNAKTSRKPTPQPVNGDETETEGESDAEVPKRKLGTPARRSSRQTTAEPTSEETPKGRASRKRTASEGSSATGKRRKLPVRASARKQPPKAEPKPTPASKNAKATKKAGSSTFKRSAESRAKTYQVRTLKRLVPQEEEGRLRKEVMKEFASFLTCDEPLTPDAKIGVSAQRVSYTQGWEDRFVELLVFKKTHGHCLVPKLHTENRALGRFVAKVRGWDKTGDANLTKSRRKRLDGVGFVWDAKACPDFWQIQNNTQQANERWEQHFDELLVFKEENDTCMVPKSYPPNQALARWVSKQRRHRKAKREGEYNTLDDDKEARLTEVDFIFETKTHALIRESVLKRFEGRWQECVDRLLKFKKTNGHCAIPRRYKPDQNLASWVMRQRSQWKLFMEGKHSYLTEERIKRLREIDFVFEVDRRTRYPVAGRGSAAKSKQAIKAKRDKSAAPDTASENDTEEEDEPTDTEGEESDNGEDVDKDGKTPVASKATVKRTSSTSRSASKGRSRVSDSAAKPEAKRSSRGRAPVPDSAKSKEVTKTGRRKRSPPATEVAEAPTDGAKTPLATQSKHKHGSNPPQHLEASVDCDDKGRSENENESENESESEEKVAVDESDTAPPNDDEAADDSSELADVQEVLFTTPDKSDNNPTSRTKKVAETKQNKSKEDQDAVGSLKVDPDAGTASEKEESDDAKEMAVPEVPRDDKTGKVVADVDEATAETPVIAVKLVQNADWKCSKCAQDEFENFVNASSHEAECLGLTKLAMPLNAQLD